MLPVGTLGDNWSATWNANNHQIDLQADSSGDLLGTDEWVSVNFTATAPKDTGTYTFDTTAWLNRSYSGTEDTLGGSEPQVTVTSPDWGSSDADADSWVEQNKPDSNYGTSYYLHVKFQLSSAERITYIKFDLSGLSLPSGDGSQTVVDSAVLYLYRYADGGAPSAYSISDDSWTETGITWNWITDSSHNIYPETEIADGQLSGDLLVATQWLAWSMTDYVQSECTGDGALTVALKFPDRAPDYFHHADFFSDEYSGSSCDPYLAINYATQYYLTVTSPYGTPGGEGWYDDGDTAYAGLTSGLESGDPGVQYVFDEWTNDASGTDYLQSNAITMNAPKTAVADWTTQYYLTVTSPYGTPGGEGWYDAGQPAYATVDPLTVPGPGSTQYVFTNWSDDATGTTSPSDPITMDDPKMATADWKTVIYGGYSITGPRVLTIDVLGRVVRVPVGADGRTMAAAEVLSPNGEVLLVVPEGTRVLNPDGSLVPKIEVLPAGTPLPPAGASIVSAFQFLPSGVTFDHEITVIITYDPLKVPAGAVLVFAYYDEIAGKWVEQETAGYIVGGTVVPDTVTSHISHFTYFALLAKSG
jgi:uncharacterized repeat protein (TIGR02543 family)